MILYKMKINLKVGSIKDNKAADYMGTVAHYLEYEMGMMHDPEMASEEEMEVIPGDMIPMDEDY